MVEAADKVIANVDGIFDSLSSLPGKGIDALNNFFGKLLGDAKYAPFVLAFLAALYVRKRYGEGWFGTVVAGLIVLLALQHVGVGG